MDKYRLNTLKVSEYKNFPVNGNNFYRYQGNDTFSGFVANCYSGFWFPESFWLDLREAKNNNPDNYKAMKEFLPAYTLCAEYSGRRKQEFFVTYNNLIGIDIDPGENPNIKDWPGIRDRFFNAWPEVVLSSLSASGQGVFMVFALKEYKAENYEQTKSNHKRFYIGLERAFKKLDIVLDSSCKDVPRLRFATYDPDLKYRALITKEFELPTHTKRKPQRAPKYNHKQNGHYDPFTHAVNAANKRWGQFSDGIKHNWINTATYVMKKNNVPQHERENFIINNYMDKSEINTNCLQ